MSKKDYDLRYQKENVKRVYLTLSKVNDRDIIEWLDRQSNKNGAIKTVIREKIKGE